MRVTDVIKEAYGAPGSKSLGIGNFQLFVYHFGGRKTSQNLKLEMGNDTIIEIKDADVDKLAQYYNNLPDTDTKKDFVYNVMSRDARLIPVLDRIGAVYTTQSMNPAKPTPDSPQGDLFENKKKDSEASINRDTVKDPKLAVALRKAYAQQPSARSDIEALFRSDLEAQAATQDDLEQQLGVNQRQQRNIETLRDLSRKQAEMLAQLDKENDTQSKEITNLEKELSGIEQKLGMRKDSASARSKDREPKAAPAITTAKRDEPGAGVSIPSMPNKPVGTTKKPQSATAPTTEPKATDGAVTPVVPSGPAPSGGQIVPFPTSTAVSTRVRPADRPSTPALPDAPIATTDTGDAVFRSLSRDQRQGGLIDMGQAEEIPQELQRDLFRTGTMGENKTLQRIKELSGIKPTK